MQKLSLIIKIFLFLGYFLFCELSYAQDSTLSTSKKKTRFQTSTNLSLLEGQAGKNHYNRALVNSLIEYSLPNKMSLGTNLQGSYIDSQYKNGTNEFSLNFIEIWHRWRFYQDSHKRITVQNLYRFPGIYDVNRNIGLDPKQRDYELRVLFDLNMTEGLISSIVHRSTPYLLRLELAHRWRFEDHFNEMRYGLSAAYRISYNYTFLFQNFGFYNVYHHRAATDHASKFYKINIKNDAINMATFSLVRNLSEESAIQIGYVRQMGGFAYAHDNQGIQVGFFAAF